MKREWIALSRRYQDALQKDAKAASSRVRSAQLLGQQAVTLGLATLDLARIHKAALAALLSLTNSPVAQARQTRHATLFFEEAIIPIQKAHRAGMKSAAELNRQNKTLMRRTARLVIANRNLKQGIVRRKTAEAALRKSGRHNAKLLRESHQLQKHLQRLAHQILSAQENERRNVSHELDDEIAQTLLGIHVRLLILKKGATERTEDFAKQVASTQRMVKKSVTTINRFAREFRIQHET